MLIARVLGFTHKSSMLATVVVISIASSGAKGWYAHRHGMSAAAQGRHNPVAPTTARHAGPGTKYVMRINPLPGCSRYRRFGAGTALARVRNRIAQGNRGCRQQPITPGKRLQLIAERARTLIQAETLLIPILSPDLSEYTYRAGCGKNAEEIVGTTLPRDYGICGWVWENRRPWWRGVLDELDEEEQTRWEHDAGAVISGSADRQGSLPRRHRRAAQTERWRVHQTRPRSSDDVRRAGEHCHRKCAHL